MNKPLQVRTRSARLSCVLLGLAACVFLWGLQYKLSLYEPAQAATPSIPMAKLLSKNEQTTLQSAGPWSADELRRPSLDLSWHPAEFSLLLLVFFAPAFFACWLRYLQGDIPHDQRSRAMLNAFFFRPPPTAR